MLPEKWESRAYKNMNLSEYTTFQVGGPAKRLIEINHRSELVSLVRDLYKAGIDWQLLGGGSNVLVDDSGYDGVVVVFRSFDDSIWNQDNLLTASAASPLHDIATYSAFEGLAGMEFAAGIPGTLGGAIWGNAGAFGQQVGDILDSVMLLNRDGSITAAGPEQLGFSYRNSILKESGQIVLQATFKLDYDDPVECVDRIDKILAFRMEKHPNLSKQPSAGSFFKNLEPTSSAERRQAAGAFLEEAGAKEMSIGGASVFYKHANIIVTNGTASAKDIITLARKMRQAVLDQFGIDLKREVSIWPKELGADLPDK